MYPWSGSYVECGVKLQVSSLVGQWWNRLFQSQCNVFPFCQLKQNDS